MENKFKERINELLEDLEISKREMARQCNISAQSISDWSTGKIQPTAEMIFIICNKYNKSADYMLGITNNEEKPNIKTKYYKCKF